MPGGPRLNLTSADEHIPEIERRIWVVKERSRAMRHSLPFNRIPKLITIHAILNIGKMLNYYLTKGGIGIYMSPQEILNGEDLNYNKHLKLQFGQYCQVQENDTPRNSEKARTQGSICLGQSGNQQGGYQFMILKTGKKITMYSWDEIPMPDTGSVRTQVYHRATFCTSFVRAFVQKNISKFHRILVFQTHTKFSNF